MGNDDEDSGEGYKFRGRGFIQLTGHTNYSLFGENIGMDVDQVVDYLETPEGAAMSAGWFWHRCHLNDWADRGDVVMCTRRINGGLNGLADRKTLYKEALTVF
jgi:putative chitinase